MSRLTIRSQRALLIAVGACTALGLGGRSALACTKALPFTRLGSTAANTLRPLPLALMGGAVLMPMAMAPTGIDHRLRLVSQRELGGRPNAEPVSVVTPFVLPVLLVGVDVVALTTESCDIMRPTSAMLEAVGLTFSLVAALKYTTAREWPNAGADPRASDRLEHPENARRFDWFSLERGTAWPSGHTATMVAAASALTASLNDSIIAGSLGYAASAGVAAGMWLGDHHWASDILSGALMGFAIGRSTGLAFRQDREPLDDYSVMLVPFTTEHLHGLAVTGLW